MVFQGMQGSDLGRPTVINAESAFGSQGAGIVISFILGVSLMGWFGVQTGVTGVAFSSMMAELGVDISVSVSTLIWGLIMMSTAIIGYKALSFLNYIAVPALIVLCVYGIVLAAGEYGWQGLLQLEPSSSMPVFSGVAMVVGGFAVGAAIAADYSRYNKNRTDAALSIVLGVVPAGLLMIFAGATIAAAAGSPDITQVISSLGFPVLGMIILILATWTTNVVNAYSGGLAVTNMFRLKGDKRALTTAIAGIVGTALALFGILDGFVTFLSILTAGIVPLAGVMITDYWIKRKGRPENWAPVPGVNWAAVIAWLGASAISYFVTWGITAVNGIVSALVLYLLLDALLNGKRNRQPA